MPKVPGFRRNFRFPWRSATEIRNEIDTELGFHIDMRTEDLVAEGLDEAAARSQAKREFGDLEAARAGLRRRAQSHETQRRHFTLWEELVHDLRFALRTLRRSPGFTAIAILVLALGIGANAAIFSVVNVVLLKPRNVERPDELVGIYSRSTETPDSYRAFSYPAYLDLKDADTGFSSITAFDLTMVGLGEQDMTRRVMAGLVAADYFDTFGVHMTLGRAFSPEEERPGSDTAVAILSYRLWQNTGADENVLGTLRTINGREFHVVGVAPEDFTGSTAVFGPDLYLPLGMRDHAFNQFFDQGNESLSDRATHVLILIGRLLPDRTPEQAEVALAGVAARLGDSYPDTDADRTFVTAALSRAGISTTPRVDDPIAPVAVLLMGMAAVVLLIACLNLANMLLARGAGRHTEVAVRAALGGGRSRLLRQLLTEGLLLALLGGVAGLTVAMWLSRTLLGSILQRLPFGVFVFDTTPDTRVFAATLGFCVLATVFFALGPAWRLTRPELTSDLKEQSRGSTGGSGGRLRSRNVLVVAQIALSLALLTAGGLFVRGMSRASNLDPGFSLEGQLMVETDPSLVGYDAETGQRMYRELLDELRALPGVENVGLASVVPFGNIQSGRRARRLGDANADNTVQAQLYVVSDDYFAALGLPRCPRSRLRPGGHAEHYGAAHRHRRRAHCRPTVAGRRDRRRPSRVRVSRRRGDPREHAGGRRRTRSTPADVRRGARAPRLPAAEPGLPRQPDRPHPYLQHFTRRRSRHASPGALDRAGDRRGAADPESQDDAGAS